MEGEISVLLGPGDAQNNNKRKHEGWIDLASSPHISSFANVSSAQCPVNATSLTPSCEEAGCIKAPRIRQARTATASMVAELAVVRSQDAVGPCTLSLTESWTGGEDRCDSITSACSALSLEKITNSIWCDLPDDVLRRILDNLPSYALRVVRSVCRGWLQAANRSLRFARPERLPHTFLAASFPNLRVLDLSCCNAALEISSPVELSLRSGLQDAALAQLVGLDRLQELVLRGCTHLQGPGLAYLAGLPSLEHLDLTGCNRLTDMGLAEGLSGLAHVAAVTLLNCNGLTDASIASLTTLPSLQRLAVPPRTTDDGLRMLAAAVGVQRVAIRGCAQVGPDGIAALLRAPNLKRVVVSRCPRVTASALDSVAPNLSVVSCAVPGMQQVAGVGVIGGGPAPGGALHMGGTGTAGVPAVAASDLQLLMATFHN